MKDSSFYWFCILIHYKYAEHICLEYFSLSIFRNILRLNYFDFLALLDGVTSVSFTWETFDILACIILGSSPFQRSLPIVDTWFNRLLVTEKIDMLWIFKSHVPPCCCACPLPGDSPVKCQRHSSDDPPLLVWIINGLLTHSPCNQLAFSRLCNLVHKTARTGICSCRFPLDEVRCCWWRIRTLSGKTALVHRDDPKKTS
jgi:hypothetical protein